MLPENYAAVSGKIRLACLRAHRPPASVQLIAITKAQPVARIIEARTLGIRQFGENRVQEAEKKIAELEGEGFGAGTKWHFVGTLQRNKAAKAAALFDLIHSVDSLKLAEKIDVAAAGKGKIQDVLLQVNASGEGTKAGFSPQEIDHCFPALLRLKNLSIRGLMAVPPLPQNPEDSRRHFRALRDLRDELRKRHSHPLGELSMGMSADFEVAIEEGATMVRVGTALFGKRVQ